MKICFLLSVFFPLISFNQHSPKENCFGEQSKFIKRLCGVKMEQNLQYYHWHNVAISVYVSSWESHMTPVRVWRWGGGVSMRTTWRVERERERQGERERERAAVGNIWDSRTRTSGCPVHPVCPSPSKEKTPASSSWRTSSGKPSTRRTGTILYDPATKLAVFASWAESECSQCSQYSQCWLDWEY